MAAETPAPIRPGPSDKERKYDRQLRLWAATGQAALENAHILLLNSGPGVAGVETLKNLVLPGIGHFTIQDAALVEEADLGVNFFVEQDDVGKMRADVTVKWLAELNPDVTGHAVTEPVETFLANPANLAPYTFILLAQPASPATTQLLSAHASSAQIPLFNLHSTGFYGLITSQLPSAFPIVDTHPDPAATQDLRLLEPWPELAALAAEKTANIDQMDADKHGHIPYVLLLLHHLAEWRAGHDGKAPETYKEKTAFREQVRSAGRNDGPEGYEGNYEEAVNAVLKTIAPHAPSSAVKAVFAAPECQHPTAASADFWLIAHAVSAFHAATGQLPLSGVVPDMKATSADYIALQNVYKAKARADAAAVTARVRALESALAGRAAPPVPDAEIAAFCKAAASIKLVRGSAPPALHPQAELPISQPSAARLLAELGAPDSPVPLYIAFQAYTSYANSHADASAALGAHAAHALTADSAAAAASKLAAMAQHTLDTIIKRAGTRVADPEYSDTVAALGAHAAELLRAGGGELHSVAAVLGGVAAQEAIKVVTRQYVPFDNVCVYDGVRSVTGVLKI